MERNPPRLIIGALRGGTGKTIVSLAIISGWRNKGLVIAPFKKGPDFIDAAWLAGAAGQACYNLDTFLMDKNTVLKSFLSRTEGKAGAVIEGNRGIYDGVDEKGTHSTATLAKLLKAPVILVVDATKATRTLAALILGCQKMDPRLEIKGIILNKIGGNRHRKIICSSIEKTCRIPILGEVPKLKEVPFLERQLGLVPPAENSQKEKSLEFCKEIGLKYLDLDGLWRVATLTSGLSASLTEKEEEKKIVDSSVRIGVINDAAFHFYYPENIEELEKRGGKIIGINALEDRELPSIDGLYIGGGFPEVKIEELAANRSFRASLLKAIENGLPVYAECGGAMYLGESIYTRNKFFPMTGIFPVIFGVDEKPWGHGYTILKSDAPNPFFKIGSVIRGHEFHYSRVLKWEKNLTPSVFKVERGFGLDGKRDGLCYKNVLSSYTHIHALGEKRWATALIKKAEWYKNN